MTSRSRRIPVVFLVALGLALEARSLGAVDCSVAKPGFPPSNASLFTLSGPGLTTTELQNAIGYWSCPAYLDEVPTMQIGGSGGVPVNIVKINGNSDNPNGSCGFASPHPVNGEIASATITVWTHDSSGGSCAPLYDVVAHELGHVMG